MDTYDPIVAALAQAARPFFDQAWAAAAELGYSELETVECLIATLENCSDNHDIISNISPYIIDYVITFRCLPYVEAFSSQGEFADLSTVYAIRRLLFLKQRYPKLYMDASHDNSLVGACEEIGFTAASLYEYVREVLSTSKHLPKDHNRRVIALKEADKAADELVMSQLICACL